MAAQSKVIKITITRPFEDVYAFLGDLEKFALWASGVGRMLGQFAPNEWFVESPSGKKAKIRIVPLNEYGIADHFVNIDGMKEIYVPMRAIRNGNDTDVMITLFKSDDMSEEQYNADGAHIKNDLEALKNLLES